MWYMKTLAIDQSTKLIWWAVFENGKLILSWNENVEVKWWDVASPIIKLSEFTDMMILKHSPIMVCTEDPMSLARVNPRVCFQLCMSLSWIIMSCKRAGIQLELLSPSAIKKHATGKGNAKKEEVRDAIQKKENKKFSSFDECDAIAIWYTAISTCLL